MALFIRIETKIENSLKYNYIAGIRTGNTHKDFGFDPDCAYPAGAKYRLNRIGIIIYNRDRFKYYVYPVSSGSFSKSLQQYCIGN